MFISGANYLNEVVVTDTVLLHPTLEGKQKNAFSSMPPLRSYPHSTWL